MALAASLIAAPVDTIALWVGLWTFAAVFTFVTAGWLLQAVVRWAAHELAWHIRERRR
jgi:hypothetical protein